MSASLVASAQTEQWLQYTVNREGQSYHYIVATTNRPPNLVLPTLSNSVPYFARWITPMDTNGGRWVCFDSTRKNGPYDRVFFDSNGNGRLDDKPAIKASRTESSYTYFDPVRLTFKGEDGPITYHLLFRFYKYDNNTPQVLVQSGGTYEGVVDLGGKKQKITLVDGNVNGTFNDRLPNAQNDCDRVAIEATNTTPMQSLGRYLEIAGEFYDVEVARDGAYIKLKKNPNVVLGKMHVPETISELTAVGENGLFVRKPVKGEFSLPIGQYKIEDWEIKRKDDKGAVWTLSGYRLNDKSKFEIKADKPGAMELGEPIRAVVSYVEAINKEISFNLSFTGLYGETMQFMKGNERPRGPKLTLVSPDGSIRMSNTFEFG
jgi:hypothetical protein